MSMSLEHIRSTYSTLKSDEAGVAYGAGIIVIGLVFFGLLLIFLSYPMDMIVDSFNDIVTDEAVSENTTSAFGFNILILKSAGFIILLGFALWGINRAILTKTGGE